MYFFILAREQRIHTRSIDQIPFIPMTRNSHSCSAGRVGGETGKSWSARPNNYATYPEFNNVNTDTENHRMYLDSPSTYVPNPTAQAHLSAAPVQAVELGSVRPAERYAARSHHPVDISMMRPVATNAAVTSPGSHERYAYSNVDGNFDSDDVTAGFAPGGCMYAYLGAALPDAPPAEKKAAERYYNVVADPIVAHAGIRMAQPAPVSERYHMSCSCGSGHPQGTIVNGVCKCEKKAERYHMSCPCGSGEGTIENGVCNCTKKTERYSFCR